VTFLLFGLEYVKVVQDLFLFLSLVCYWFVFFLRCICRFRLRNRFCGKLLIFAIGCIYVHSFCLFFGVNGRECILVLWYLKAAILCSMGWFRKKLVVASVVIGFRNMSISSLDGFRIINRSRKLMHLLFSYVGLDFIIVFSAWHIPISVYTVSLLEICRNYLLK
jgi:hypothetical protein